MSYLFPAKGLDHVAETILAYLDASSLRAAELVCKEWYRVISDGMLWKKLIERMVRTDTLWRGLADRRGWYVKFNASWNISKQELKCPKGVKGQNFSPIWSLY